MSKELDLGRIPNHIAIIMDGNGRWAKKRMLPHMMGHKAGAQALRKLSVEVERLGVKYLTVYAFSTENWKRSNEEVNSLMNLLRDYIKQYIDDSEKNDMKITVIGDMSRLDIDLQEKIRYLQDLTKDKPGINIIIALNYGGRDEILRAAKTMCTDFAMNKITENDINEELFSNYLDTKDIAEPDLLIRTSGEMRISNFLLWQLAYTELYFTDKLWPDFTIDDLIDALLFYQQKDRRFGGR